MRLETAYARIRGAADLLGEGSRTAVRRLLRLLALPYCYFALVNWRECRASRLRVAHDLLYIFCVLRTFPDHYSPCRLWEKQRASWTAYYGSIYHPNSRGRLRRRVQPAAYKILFDDKGICDRLCRQAGLPVPRLVGALPPGSPPAAVRPLLAAAGLERAILKPLRGAKGDGILLAEEDGGELRLRDAAARAVAPARLAGSYVVQEVILQHPTLAAFSASSVNTLRVLTMLDAGGRALVLSALVRFGVGGAVVDNWSAGGVAVGVDLESGTLLKWGLDRRGRRQVAHPDSGLIFEGSGIPHWASLVELSLAAQRAFPFYRLLGLDVAVTDSGPLLVEINASPDLVGQEQISGPLLARPDVWQAFLADDLLYNERQRRLHPQVSRQADGKRPRRRFSRGAAAAPTGLDQSIRRG